ncbi:hypothetical protein C923_04197 [Plasmodium falciparum UGT5.1]|uniref:5-formyltetrahydrofolate cyclo-ligase n=1 Tax=Plasmodium falciparum UGT5.1 TaxID=1237627 RepID=W7J943_PLAFA|nr:hypothetical protein C923_04197 [Plasmodium falciparum UGT5.1]
MDVKEYTHNIIDIDISNHIKIRSSNNYNNKKLKETIRQNAKKIRDITFKYWIKEKQLQSGNFVINDENINDKMIIENKKDIINNINNDKKISYSYVDSFQTCVTNSKDEEGVLYIDDLYTYLIRQLYILFCSLEVRKKKNNVQFDFTRIYKYTYNYKKLESPISYEYLKKYDINDDIIKNDIENFHFYAYDHNIEDPKKYCDMEENYNNANYNICIYLPTKKEIDILFIIDQLYDYFYFVLYVPITTKEKDLIFFPFNIKNNLLVQYHFNIFIPYDYIYYTTYKKMNNFILNYSKIVKNYELSNSLYKHNDTIILIPLIAYNKLGYRIGSGKGYYDKTLTKTRKKNDIIKQIKNIQMNDNIITNNKDHDIQKENHLYLGTKNDTNNIICSNVKNIKHKTFNNEIEIYTQNKQKIYFNEIKIGVSFEMFLYDIDFSETTDLILDYMINENNIYHFIL